ncbi:hypothetical protein HFN89_05135 [Rhizobium laguerreae]|nr:hypothetical protein [Rhizobium laguerreae]
MKLTAALLSAIVLSASAAMAAEQPVGAPETEFFDHNGSTIVAQYKYGNLRYMKVKPSLRGLVDEGMAAFSGDIEWRGAVHGTAYVFKKGCPFVPYEVSGRYDPTIPGYVMTGAYPVRSKKGCDVVSYSNKGANARLVFVDTFERDRRQVKMSKSAQDAYIDSVYETEGGEDYMDGFISSEELERRNRKGRP